MKKTFLIISALFLALLLFSHPVRSFVTGKIAPGVIDVLKLPLKAITTPVRGIYNLATFKNRYEKTIDTLQKKISVLTRIFVETKEINEENKRLRMLMAFRSRLTLNAVPAEVIGRSPSSWDDFIIIGKGLGHGVKRGMAVVKEEGLVGRVYEAGQWTATVMLIDNPNSKIGVAVQRTREQGVLVGLGGGLCKVIYLGYNTDAKPGDIVVVSEFSGIALKGMVTGEITKVLKNPDSVYASAIVKPSCNLFKIEEVLCVE